MGRCQRRLQPFVESPVPLRRVERLQRVQDRLVHLVLVVRQALLRQVQSALEVLAVRGARGRVELRAGHRATTLCKLAINQRIIFILAGMRSPPQKVQKGL